MEQIVFDSSWLFRFRLNMNEQQLSSTKFKSIRVGLMKHNSFLNDVCLVAKDPLKLNNSISTSVISSNIILLYS